MESNDIFQNEKLSLWLKDGINRTYSTLDSNKTCDICIIGAGITGITTAFLLSKKYNVILIDKNRPLHLSTGNTTAKITFQHSLNYSEIIERYSEKEARLYYEAQTEGIELVKKLVNENNISCNFKEVSAMVYAETKDRYDEILKEKNAYDKLGIPHELIDHLPYGLQGVGGLKVDNQVQINPIKYLESLLEKLESNNVSIFQDTTAIDIEEKDDCLSVLTKGDFEIKCTKVVVATGYPFFEGSGKYFSKLKPYRSYLVAFPIESSHEEDLMLISNSEPLNSIRFACDGDNKYLLIGGGGHKVGQEDSALDGYKEIVDFGKKFFNVTSPSFRWSAQDYVSVDKIPYIGQISSRYKNIFIATGFKKWGMSNGSFAGLLLSNLIENKTSKYVELFSPTRKEITSNMSDFIKLNYDVAKELIQGKIFQKKEELEDIKEDIGGIIEYKGKKLGAYRDKYGKLFLVDNTCTHLGCELEYNNAERSFDCPCHGSRFNYDGKVIECPALKDLKRIDE